MANSTFSSTFAAASRSSRHSTTGSTPSSLSPQVLTSSRIAHLKHPSPDQTTQTRENATPSCANKMLANPSQLQQSSSLYTDGSVPALLIHSRINSYQNCVISSSVPATVAQATSAKKSSSTPEPKQYYHRRQLQQLRPTAARMPQATNLSNNSPSSADNRHNDDDDDNQQTVFNNTTEFYPSAFFPSDQRRSFSPMSLSSMPFRTAFARHGRLREDLFPNDFFDNVFQSDFNRRPAMSFDDNDSDDLFVGLTERRSSSREPTSMERQSQVITHPIRRLDSSEEEYNSNNSDNVSRTTTTRSWNTHSSDNPRDHLDDNLIHHIIHNEADPDQLQQRVKIFIAQDRARGLGAGGSNNGNGSNSSSSSSAGTLSDTSRQILNTSSFPRISARIPHGGSLSFSFSTSSNSSTLHINDDSDVQAHVPPHHILTIEQKKLLKQRLLAQKQDLIAGPNTSATILTSDEFTDTPKVQTNAGSVADRVMWFEGVPQLQITHQIPGRLQRSAAHIALQNWRNGIISDPGEAYRRSPSVERTIPIIRETDFPPQKSTSAVSITLEVPAKQNAKAGSVDILTPSKPGNHIFTAPQSALISDSTTATKSPPISSQKTSTKGFDYKSVEHIIPTILPSPEPKPVDRKILPDGEVRSVRSPEIQKASETIIKALQNGMRRDELKDEVVVEKIVNKPKPVVSPPKVTSPKISAKEHVPQFHYPKGKPTDRSDSDFVLMEKVRKSFGGKAELKLDEVKDLMAALGLPLYWRKPFLLFAASNGTSRETITFDMAWNAWKKVTAHCHDDAARFVFLLAKPGCHYLLPNDLIPLVQDVVDTHPGLNILKEAPEFHARYTNTVIARIFYGVNRSWSGRITVEELRRSSFLGVLATLDREDDINVVTEYFSYEHFYVIYCKFWELDRDHDLFIDKNDLARHNDHAISSKMIDRIFSGAVTQGPSQKEGKMSYAEFVWFLLAEEDKRHPRSIEYWFRCMDIDGDGALSLYELEYFYMEQLLRMKTLGIEALPFEDIACQMLDMVHPKHKNRILLKDLKRCRMTPLFFDTFFNIEKYLLHEHRDPFASAKVDAEDNEPISDWDRYAAEEYEILVSEDAASEDL